MDRRLHKRHRLRGIVLILLVIALCVALEKAAGGQTGRIVDWVRSLGALGPVAFVGMNALGIVLFLPQTPFTLAAGILFGWLWGTVYSLAAMGIGATMAFLLARYGMRGRLVRQFGSEPMFLKMRDLSYGRPWHVLAVSRFVPVFHYALASYLLGLTEVRLVPFVLMSILCLVPETLLLASGGHALMTGLLHGAVQPGIIVALVVAALILGGIAGVLMRRVRNR